MKSEQQDLLKLQTSADGEQSKESSNGEQLMEREEMIGSPFWCIGNKVDGYFIAFGKHRVTPVKNTQEEVIDYINENMWTVVAVLCGVIAEITVQDTLKNQKD